MYPDNCDPATNCVVAVSYRPTAQQTVAFELQATFESTETLAQYVALGLSDDNQMSNDAVTHCIHANANNQGVVGLSFNPAKVNQPLGNRAQVEPEMLSNSSYWSQNLNAKFIFVCRFEQKYRSQLEPAKVFDLTKPYYILLATGPADPNTFQLQRHNVQQGSPYYPVVSPAKIIAAAPALNQAGSPPPQTQPGQQTGSSSGPQLQPDQGGQPQPGQQQPQPGQQQPQPEPKGQPEPEPAGRNNTTGGKGNAQGGQSPAPEPGPKKPADQQPHTQRNPPCQPGTPGCSGGASVLPMWSFIALAVCFTLSLLAL